MGPSEQTRKVVCDDIESPFVESVAKFAAWEYRCLYDTLAGDPLLTNEQRAQEFGRRRALAISKAMIQAAKKHNLPYDIRRLKCNGQSKVLVKIGRVILVQEAMATLYGHKPQAATYKEEISRYAGVITQLELDLGDRPQQLLDWSDGVLAVLLHGACGSRFAERECELGALMLAVPDAAYENWIIRLDLHDIALFGGVPVKRASGDANNQEDRVIVRRKIKKSKLRSNG
ncbi:hypothetical protein [Ensifer aridi]|uniref:hypothetical protein n=1 Tax=Ensifer aridi TaxID=1708715 RepID=UPI000A1191D3|nr:hypothetical protein [Ensifer aridi]